MSGNLFLIKEVESGSIQSTGRYIHDIAMFKSLFEVTASYEDTLRSIICVPLFFNDVELRRVVYVPYYFKHYKIKLLMLDD